MGFFQLSIEKFYKQTKFPISIMFKKEREIVHFTKESIYPFFFQDVEMFNIG